MPTYHLRLIAPDGVIRSAGHRDAASDEAVCEVASEVLLQSRFPVIEVWRSDEIIYRVSKIDPDEDASAP